MEDVTLNSGSECLKRGCSDRGSREPEEKELTRETGTLFNFLKMSLVSI